MPRAPESEFPVLPTDSDLSAVRTALASWFEENQRSMDWRSTPSLYRTVVSEFMLQQTRVDTVRPYFARWTALWPDFAALACASEAEVVKAWEGLGYYTRARNLRRLAIAVAAMPVPPRTAREWATLPGVGPYTAAAIASIAGGEPVAVVDGNVVRVLSRLMADAREFKDNGAAVKAFAAPASRLLDPAAPGMHNQAVMELGALICLPRAPLCAQCPVERFCAAARGTPENFPRFAPRKIEKVAVARLLCIAIGHVLLFRHGPTARRLAGIYELPDARLFASFRPSAPPASVKRRAISNQLITETIHRVLPEDLFASSPATVVGPAALLPLLSPTSSFSGGTLEWVPTPELSRIPLSGPHRKWLPALLHVRTPA